MTRYFWIFTDGQQQRRLSRQYSLTDQDCNVQDRKQRSINPRQVTNGQQLPASSPEGGGLSAEGKQPPPRQRRGLQSHGSLDERTNPAASASVNKDCFVIPEENLERFLPDGITVRKF